MSPTQGRVRAALVAAVTLVVTVCGSLLFLQTASSAAIASVAIQNYAFSPSFVTITVGSSVTWTNDDSVDHTVTQSGRAGFDSRQIAPGGSYSHQFTVAGTYAYHCADHPMMTATVRVVPATTPTPTPHPTPTHPTTRPPPHVTSTPAPHPPVHVSATPPAGPLLKTPSAAPSRSASAIATPLPKHRVTVPASSSASAAPALAASPTSHGSTSGGSHEALWWIAGAVVVVAAGAGWLFRRRAGH